MKEQIYNPFQEIFDRISALEIQLASRPKPIESAPLPKNLDINQLASYLGNVPIGTIYQWIHKNYIPNHRVGKRVFFDRDTIEQWLQDKKRKTVSERVSEIRNK